MSSVDMCTCLAARMTPLESCRAPFGPSTVVHSLATERQFHSKRLAITPGLLDRYDVVELLTRLADCCVDVLDVGAAGANTREAFRPL